MTHRVLFQGEPNCEPDKYPPVLCTFRARKMRKGWVDEFGHEYSRESALKVEKLPDSQVKYYDSDCAFHKPVRQFPHKSYDTGSQLGYHISLDGKRLAFISKGATYYFNVVKGQIEVVGWHASSQKSVREYVTADRVVDYWVVYDCDIFGDHRIRDFVSADNKRIAFTSGLNYYYEVARGRLVKYGYAAASVPQRKKFLNYKRVKIFGDRGGVGYKG